MTEAPLVGVVVLNYNGKDCLSACLASLQNLDYQRFFLLVVDNGSTDGSLEAALQQFPQCSFRALSENRGFASGMNYGIEVAFAQGADYVWIFNNDATAEREALSRLIAAAEHDERAGLLSPWIIGAQAGRLWFGQARVNWWRMRVEHVSPTERERKMTCYESECLTGCALLLRRTVWEKVGSFDERFFLYYEDADLSLRAAAAGFRLLVVPEARVFHREQSEARPEKVYFLVLSGLLFFQKYASFWQRPYFSAYGTIRRLKNYFDTLRGRDAARWVRQAYDDFYHG